MSDLVLSIDAMGGDSAPDVVLDGIRLYRDRTGGVRFLLHGRESELKDSVEKRGISSICDFVDQPDVVSMSAKPSSALRKAKGTSMWSAIEAVKDGRAAAAIPAR